MVAGAGGVVTEAWPQLVAGDHEKATDASPLCGYPAERDSEGRLDLPAPRGVKIALPVGASGFSRQRFETSGTRTEIEITLQPRERRPDPGTLA